MAHWDDSFNNVTEQSGETQNAENKRHQEVRKEVNQKKEVREVINQKETNKDQIGSSVGG